MSRCRSCGAEILWAVTTSGKRMPVDATPEPYGNVQLETVDGVLRASVVGHGDGTHVAHFATCPDVHR